MGLWDDRRGQPVQIGFILLFGILIVALTIYQVNVVPRQNAAVEYDHSQEVQEDLTKLRGAIVEASYPNQAGVVTVDLGTGYPTRMFALNPPPTTGTLRTTDPGDVSVSGVSNVCPGDEETRRLTYQPNYNVYDGPTTTYENSILHHAQGSGEALLSGQSLVFPDEGVVNIIALRGDYSESTTSAVNVEVIPGNTRRTENVQNPTITLPTGATRETWERALADVSYDSLSVASNEVEIGLSGDYDVLCTPVGIDSTPPSGANKLKPPGSGSGDGGGGDGGGGGSSGPPTFASDPIVRDESSWSGKAQYEVQYSVDNPSGNFSEVQAEFNCIYCSGNRGDKTKSSTKISDTIIYTGPGNSGGEFYRITVTVFDNSGSVTDTYTINFDFADGNDP